MDDLEPFESPKLLIEGAKESLADFETKCTAFVDRCTYKVVTHEDPTTRERVIKFRFDQRIPGFIRRDAYRIVGDLRNALDHAVCDAAIELGRTDAKSVYFPFCKHAGELNGQAQRQCRDVDPDLVSFIKAFNPYYGGDNLLYALNTIGNPNKHQRVLRVSIHTTGGVLNSEGLLMVGPAKFNINKWNDLRNELEFARVSATGHFEMNFAPTLFIVINTGEPPFSSPAAAVFRDMISKVESIVLGIEAETARILKGRAS